MLVSGPTDPYPDRDGQVLHWYAAVHLDGPKIGLLREPLAMMISHLNSVPRSRMSTELVWQSRLDRIRECWLLMLKHFFDTPFVRVEELSGPDTGDARVLKHMMSAYLERDVDLSFDQADRHASDYPLKEAYERRDALALLGALPHEAVDALATMPEYVRRLYASMYDIDWWLGELA